MIEHPASYEFDEVQIGQQSEFTVVIDKSIIESFAQSSGDYNPLHMDDAYAIKSGFGGRVAHGMLVASFFSRLIGMYLPGKNALYFAQTLEFQTPCFVGDTLTIRGIITDKSESTKIISIKTSAYNQHGKCLVEGIAKVIVREESN